MVEERSIKRKNKRNIVKRQQLLLVLAALTGLFLLYRGGLILFGYLHISHPGIDEPVSGVLARDLLHGLLRIPLLRCCWRPALPTKTGPCMLNKRVRCKYMPM